MVTQGYSHSKALPVSQGQSLKVHESPKVILSKLVTHKVRRWMCFSTMFKGISCFSMLPRDVSNKILVEDVFWFQMFLEECSMFVKLWEPHERWPWGPWGDHEDHEGTMTWPWGNPERQDAGITNDYTSNLRNTVLHKRGFKRKIIIHKNRAPKRARFF